MNRNRTRISAVAVLALGVLGTIACNTDERASKTYITSAAVEKPAPIDRSGVAQPMGAIPDTIRETTVVGDPSLAGPGDTDDNGATSDETGARHAGELDDDARWTGGGADATRATNPFVGTKSGDGTSKVTNDQGGAGAKVDGVGPGHIWYTPSTVPEPKSNARGTGTPNSNGSHNLGSATK